MTLSRFERLTALLDARHRKDSTAGVRLIPTERIVERSRVIKDAGEVATFRTATAMLSEVALRVLDIADGCCDHIVDVRVLQALDEKPLQHVYALFGRP